MLAHCNILRLAVSAVALLMAQVACCASYQTRIMQTNVRTLRVQYADETLQLQRPYLVLHSEEESIDGSDPTNTLEVSFDEMSHDLRQYSYTVRHLNRDWTPSDLSSVEYLQGFTTADITDYASSTTTQQAYTHYTFTFPNSDMQLTTDGNYVLVIYENGDMDNVVATVCFSVVEPLADITAQVRSNTDMEFDGRYQQLDLNINTAALDIKDPSLVSVVVQQNGRTDNQVSLTTPTYVEPNRLRYSNKRELIFEGGNEFRHFDIYSIYYAGYHVDRMRYAQGEYHALLETDAVRGTLARGAGREGLGYLTEYDTNGQWRINAEKTDDPDIDAEYVWVHFRLPVPQPIADGQVFVGGGLFYDLFTTDNLMQYDAEEKCYYLYAYLKQGAYDYLYYAASYHRFGDTENTTRPTTRDANRQSVSLLPLEGSHWQTQNEYTVYVYYRPFGSRYDRLVGIKHVK